MNRRLVEQVREHARPVNPLRALVSLVLAVLIAVAWVAGIVWRGAGWAVGYAHTAVLVGWKAATTKREQ